MLDRLIKPSRFRQVRHWMVVTILALAFTTGCATKVQPHQDPWLGRDKALHLVAGAAVGAIGAGIAQSADTSPCGAFSGGLGLAFSIGLGKEWYDNHSATGTASGRDLLVTIAGGLIGAQLVSECHR